MKTSSIIPSPEARPGTGAQGVLRVLLVLSLVVPLLLFVTASWINYDAEMADARRDLGRMGDVAREHAARVFDGLDQVADRVNDAVLGRDAAAIRSSEPQTHQLLADIVAHLPQVQSVLLAAADGHPLASAAVFPVPASVDLRQRDYFHEVIDGKSGHYVSALQFGDVYKQVFFGLSRAWTGPGGDVRGVIDVAVSPTSFSDFYRVMLGPDGASGDDLVALVRADGEAMVRYPARAGDADRAPEAAPFLAAISANFGGGAFEAGRPDRLYSFRKVPGFPLYVVAGRSRAAIVRSWASTLAGHLVFGVPATLALFALARTALVRTRREEEALVLARQEMRRREAAEASLLQAQRLEAVGHMTGGVAHDFNNLLTIIVGNAELLQRRADDPTRVRRLAGNVLTAANRGAAVTQKLLAFSRRQLVRPQTIDLNALLRRMVGTLDDEAKARHPVVLELDPNLQPVRLDPAQFEAAIANLVSNARDAMPDGGAIRIATTNHLLAAGQRLEPGGGPCVRVTVSDTGSGMDPATLARAVEPFVTTKATGQGTGLGLSHVDGFVKQAGGDVRIVSAVGRGTTVELLLPRAPYEHPLHAPEHETAAPPGDARNGEVVLVVEDEPDVLEMAVECLSELGYVTLTASNAMAALERLREAIRIDVLFSDVVMPGGMNGMELTAEARRLRPDLRVLLTSGYAAPEIGRALPDDVPLLTKPYDQRELAASLQSVLSG